MKQSLVFLFLVISNFLPAQNEKTPCFDNTEIKQFYYQPSRKGKLTKTTKNQNIIFRRSKKTKSKAFTSRYFSRFKDSNNSISSEDSLKVDWLSRKHLVLFFANYTDSTVIIPTIVNRALVIQEAKDKNGQWRPVEFINGYIGCGTGVFGEIKLNPMEFVEIYAPKYCGDFFTKLRLKININGSVIYSEEFEGFINPKQFDLSPILKWSKWEYIHFIDSNIQDEVKKN